MFKAMSSKKVRVEPQLTLGPAEDGFMQPVPGDAEEDGVVTNLGDMELDVLGVRADIETYGTSLVGDAGRDGASIGGFDLAQFIQGVKVDGVGM
jgi:hypothetical protein